MTKVTVFRDITYFSQFDRFLCLLFGRWSYLARLHHYCTAKIRKALDNLNQMSHRYVSGVLRNDWNPRPPLTWSQRGCYIWVSLSYKAVNIVVSSLYCFKKKCWICNRPSCIALKGGLWSFRGTLVLSMLFNVNTSRNPIQHWPKRES